MTQFASTCVVLGRAASWRPTGRITYHIAPSRLWTMLPGETRALVHVRATLETADGDRLDASHDGAVVVRADGAVEVRVAIPGLDPTGSPLRADVLVPADGTPAGVVVRQGRVIGAIRHGGKGLRVEWLGARPPVVAVRDGGRSPRSRAAGYPACLARSPR